MFTETMRKFINKEKKNSIKIELISTVSQNEIKIWNKNLKL